jgi:hypothetical protein
MAQNWVPWEDSYREIAYSNGVDIQWRCCSYAIDGGNLTWVYGMLQALYASHQTTLHMRGAAAEPAAQKNGGMGLGKFSQMNMLDKSNKGMPCRGLISTPTRENAHPPRCVTHCAIFPGSETKSPNHAMI